MAVIRIAEFDTWRPGYGLASVRVLVAGTTTLASIYSDEALTESLPNPQALTERIEDDVSYGRFPQPIYVGVPYSLSINSIDETGITRPPLTTLDDQDASNALVTVTDGTEAVALADHLARRIDLRDYGEFKAVGDTTASPSTNNATLTAALGVAGANGGGFVEVPPGTYQVTSFTIPQGVVLRGAGRVATTLQSIYAGNVATIGGERAGFSHLTLDGVTLVAASVGVFSAANDDLDFDDFEVKRFETGIHVKGGSDAVWKEVYISDCDTGCKIYGDASASTGAAALFNRWVYGGVSLCTVAGIDLKNVDSQCAHITIEGVFFDTNTGSAVKITGARAIMLRDCQWDGNTDDLTIADASPATSTNTVIGVEIVGGSITDGTMTLSGNLEAVALRRVDLTSVTPTLTTPTHNMLIEDCREISGVSIGGTATSWVRHKTYDRGSSTGVTTGATATKTWAITLASGHKAYLEAKVVARGRNGIDTAFYHLGVSVGRPGATILYDTQTANFTAGNVLTGATSGATARIIADSDSGATGTLTLQDVVGTFVDNEVITDTGSGSALANGTTSTSSSALVGTVASIRAAQETDATWDATFVANGPEIELRVTGAASKTIEWTVDVDVVSS